ncbi:hypothetical protein DMENIID0001_062040 [Sergentomyia squamirostris]
MLLGAWPLGGKANLGSTTAPATKNGKFRFTLLVGGYVLFLVVGAAIFSAIEAPRLDEYAKKINLVRTSFLKKYPCIDERFSPEREKAKMAKQKGGILLIYLMKHFMKDRLSRVWHSTCPESWQHCENVFFTTQKKC